MPLKKNKDPDPSLRTELLLEAAEGSESVTEVIEDSAPAETEDAAHCVSSSALGIGAERKEITGREVADDREKERSGAPRERGMVIAGAEAARPACALSGEESGEGGKEVAGGGEKAGVAAEEVVEEDEGAKELGKQEDVAERTVGEGIEGLEAPVDGKESKEETAVEGTVEDEFVVEETVEVEMDGEAEEAVEGEKAAALAVRESGGDDGEKEGQQVDPGASGMSPPQCLAEAEGGMEPHHPPAGDETQAAAAALEEFGADAEGLEEAAVSPEIEVGGTQTPGKETQGAAAALGGLRRLGVCRALPPSLGVPHVPSQPSLTPSRCRWIVLLPLLAVRPLPNTLPPTTAASASHCSF